MMDYFNAIERFTPDTDVPFTLEINEFAKQVTDKYPNIVVETLAHKTKAAQSWELRYRSLYTTKGSEKLCKILKNNGFTGQGEYNMVYWDNDQLVQNIQPGSSFEHALAKCISGAGVGVNNAFVQNMKNLERQGQRAIHQPEISLLKDSSECIQCCNIGTALRVKDLLILTGRTGGKSEVLFEIWPKDGVPVPDSLDGFTKLQVNGFDFKISEVRHYKTKLEDADDDVAQPCGELAGFARVVVEYIRPSSIVCHSLRVQKRSYLGRSVK